MKTVGVSNIKDEADIIAATITRLVEQGVDEIITTDGMSTDGTRDILADLSNLVPITIIAGADWVIPFDADEFWEATQHPTIRDALASVDTSIVEARTYQYFDYEIREPDPKLFPKVAFRPTGPFDLQMGSHSVLISNYTGPITHGLLTIRDVQFRGFDHFVYKVRQRTAAFPPDVPSGNGAHVRSWGAMSDDELAAEWDIMRARATVAEPIVVPEGTLRERV